ncbi:hypothetical protein [Phenylobacterium sp. J367]|uniref:hypothetical protein n=1 Tax=Phenylobacterium sp. J367 TaxID=2898435 RepID=UPI0027E2E18B|nr:hypothetical protein [Phenylobacterium sp. J367]
MAEKAVAPPPPPEPPAEAVADAPKATPQEAFTAARQLMLGGDYDGAEQAFAAYVQTYPEGPRVAEARYWWGKTLTVRNAHAQAATAYIGAIRGWPQTAWAGRHGRARPVSGGPEEAHRRLPDARRTHQALPEGAGRRGQPGRGHPHPGEVRGVGWSRATRSPTPSSPSSTAACWPTTSGRWPWRCPAAATAWR